MRTIVALLVLAMGGGGCATTAASDALPLAMQTIRDAEAAGVDQSNSGAELLARARSEVAYSRRVPKDPEHARRLCQRAQLDAELAIVRARQESHRRRMTHFQPVREISGAVPTAAPTVEQ